MLTHSSKTVTINKQKAIEVRDYLMVSLTYFNCLRASNLMSITLEDMGKIKPNDEIDRAHVLKNKKYKTSMLYGAKIILSNPSATDQVVYRKHNTLCYKMIRSIQVKDFCSHLGDSR